MNFDSQVAAAGGPFSAIFTPMNAAGEINFDMLSMIGEFQLASGVKGFFVCGSTGEGLLLSEPERMAVLRHICEKFKERATIIAHVGHPSTNAAMQLARQAAADGADWIASVAPIYHGTSMDGALRHYGQISEATSLPFMIYSLGGVIDPKRDAAFFELPHVCGMKYTGLDYFSVQQLMRIVDRPVLLMSGCDEQFIAAQSFGFHGCIGSTINFAPKNYAEIFRLYQAGNIAEAARLQAEINKITSVMIEYENWTYRKAIMRYIGFNCGSCRPPYGPISEQEYEAFAKRVDEQQVLKRNEGIELLKATVS